MPALCIALFVLLNNKGGTYSNLSISQVMAQLNANNVRTMVLEGDTVIVRPDPTK